MHPLRVIILLVLLYILYRLLFPRRRRREASTGPAGPRGSLASHDVLVEDPVCHIYIPKGQAVSLNRAGVTHYFCSEQCRETFRNHEGEKE